MNALRIGAGIIFVALMIGLMIALGLAERAMAQAELKLFNNRIELAQTRLRGAMAELALDLNVDLASGKSTLNDIDMYGHPEFSHNWPNTIIMSAASPWDMDNMGVRNRYVGAGYVLAGHCQDSTVVIICAKSADAHNTGFGQAAPR